MFNHDLIKGCLKEMKIQEIHITCVLNVVNVNCFIKGFKRFHRYLTLLKYEDNFIVRKVKV